VLFEHASFEPAGTPLLGSAQTAPNLHFKLESTNPTGSYKDRFVAAQLKHLAAQGYRTCVATSSGNTGSSLAAYCARLGMGCIIAVNADAPAGKLLQMQAHGATVIRIPNFVTSPEITRDVFEQLQSFSAQGRAALVVSAFHYCPTGMRAVGKIAAEILAALPGTDHIFVPVGGGGLYVAIAEECLALGVRTKVHAVQPEGCPTLLRPFRSGSDIVEPVEADTRISGLSVPFDIDAGRALALVRRTGARVFGVTDSEVYAAQHALFRREGIYAEPAGAAALAGYRQAVLQGIVREDQVSVCVVTGHGFKDPASAQLLAEETEVFQTAAPGLTALLTELAG